jgi:hypothetical protein
MSWIVKIILTFLILNASFMFRFIISDRFFYKNVSRKEIDVVHVGMYLLINILITIITIIFVWIL